MKNLYQYISMLAVFGFLFSSQAGQILAQEKPDFSSELYREAIQDIVLSNDKFNSHSDVYAALSSGHEAPSTTLSGFRGDTIITDPVIAFMAYDDVSVTFKYIPTGQLVNDTVTVNIPANVNWLTNPIVDKTDSTLTLTAQVNTDYTPRTATFTVTGEFGAGNFVSCEATVLQGAAPQPFIVVSPNNMAVSPEGGITDLFSVTAVNIEEWEAVIDVSDTWVSQAVKTDTTISFQVTMNDTGEERQATILIQDADNPQINDIVTLFQYVDTSSYIIATPSSGSISSAATTYDVSINANIPWEIVYTDVPQGMITDSTISQNADMVSFEISTNTNTTSRIATISITGTENQNITAQIEITQLGSESPYIIVSPTTSNVGPEAGSITLDVEANVQWEYVSVENPGGMLNEVPGGQDAITFNIAENTSVSSRTAVGQIKAVGETSPAVTFYVIQDAAFILLNPREILVPCEGNSYVVDITRYKVDSIVADTSGFLWDVTIYENDSLKIDVTANTNPFPVSDTLFVCSETNPAICDTLTIFQYACNQPYIVVTPKFQSLPYQGDTTDIFEINSSNITNWEVYFENPEPWITATLIEGNQVRFVADTNKTSQSRDITFQVRSTSNATIFDTAVIFQDGAPDAVLIASPREQLISHLGNDSVDFLITYQNISGWQVDPNSIDPNWIVIDSAGGNLLSLDILENTTTSNRQKQLVLFASNDDQVRDTVSIYQYSADEKYILTAPRERIFAASGIDSAGFMVLTANVDQWLVDTDEFPEWITLNHLNDSSFSLTITQNATLATRNEIIYIKDSDDDSVYDSVQVYQHVGEQPYILISPRERIAPKTGGPLEPFLVETIGLDAWEIISKPDWLEANILPPIAFSVVVEPNNADTTRIGSVFVGDTTLSPPVLDEVKIYQFSADDSYLLAEPREKSFEQSGAESTIFHVTKANVLSWEVDEGNLPEWINVNDFGDDTLDLKILENPTYASRQDSVIIFSVEDNSVADTVFIFQFAANDTILLAAPRQQVSSFAGETLNFDITTQNAEAWKVDPESVPEWITVESQGGNLLSLETLLNQLPETRFTTVSIFDTLNPDVSDSVSIFQYAAPESYILAAPRSDTVQFFGDDFVTFNIAQFNLSGELSIDDNTVPDWISASLNGDQLQLDVSPNPLSETRDTVIFIFDNGNTGIRDSVAIFQYAQPEKYILAAPRERQLGHEGGNLFFEITTANVESWVVDTTTVPEWITNYDITPVSLSLDISQNNTLETRIASIRIYDPADETVEDFVQAYQYSGLDYYILAEPREQQMSNLADTLSFGITAVNLTTPWQAEFIKGGNFADIIAAGDTLLKVAVAENTDTLTHLISIRLYSEQHPQAADTVNIYQYSPFEPFVIISPTFERFRSGKDSLYIYTFSNLETYTISISPDEPQPPDTTWYKINKYSGSLNDSVKLVVSFNPESYKGRTSYLTFRSPDSSFVNYFHFQQRKNSLNFVTISGLVNESNENETPLDSVNIIIDQDTLLTNEDGIFTKDNVNYGWVGIVRPEKIGYFFEPANRVFNTALEQDTTLNFTGIKIQPTIRFNIHDETLFICNGEQIDFSSPDYPTISETGTFGPKSYKWFSIPDDPNLNTDSSSAPAYQVFKPIITTTYYLVLYNYGTSDTTFFTVEVNPQPATRDFNGPLDVCRNQSGVIYSVMDFDAGEYFQWELSRNGNLIKSYSSNIVTVNWNTPPGEYELTLYTLNSAGCSSSLSKTITVSNEEAPPESVVSKKSGDNMLVCSTENPDDLNFEWGWYDMSGGDLGEKYIIPDRSDWYCRLPDGHIFDPLKYSYFVQLSFKDGSACQTVSFLNGNAPVSIDEAALQPFTIFPNPTSGAVWMKFNNMISSNIMIKIRDFTGQVVAEETKNPGSVTDMILIESTKQLRKGVYFIEVQLEEMRFNTKIVVQ